MLIVELVDDDFHDSGNEFIKIGRLNKAIAKAQNPNLQAGELLNIECKIFSASPATLPIRPGWLPKAKRRAIEKTW